MRFIFCLIIITFYAVSAYAETQALSSCPIDLLPVKKSMAVSQGQAGFWQQVNEEKLIIYARQGHIPAMKQVVSQALKEKRSTEYWDHYIDIYNSLTCHKGATFTPNDRVGNFIYTSILTTLKREAFPERVAFEAHGRNTEFVTPQKQQKFGDVITYAQSFLSLKPSQAMALEFPAPETKPLVELLSYMQRRWFLVDFLLETKNQDVGSSLNLLADLYRAGGIVKREIAKSDDYKTKAFLANARYFTEPYIQYYSAGCYGVCPVYSVFYFSSGKVVFIGQDHVPMIGYAEGKVAPTLFGEIESLIIEHGNKGRRYKDLKDCFDVTDAYHVRIWSKTKKLDHTHDIYHYWGCQSDPNAGHLMTLLKEINAAFPYKAFSSSSEKALYDLIITSGIFE